MNETIFVHLISPFIITDDLLEMGMVNKFVNVSSTRHWIGNLVTMDDATNPCCDHYSNSKFSVMCMILYFPKKYPDIEVVTVNPGYVNTELWQQKSYL